MNSTIRPVIRYYFLTTKAAELADHRPDTACTVTKTKRFPSIDGMAHKKKI
jgi:hypothetical protein